jgi:competence protein ComGC
MITKLFRVITARRGRAAFSLLEILVSIAVLTLLLLIVSGLMTSATTITRTGNKHIDTDTQARLVLDRMAIDFAQMLKRTDVDYYIKQPDPTKYKGHGNGHGNGQKVQSGQLGSDQIAFFSQVPGYYPSGAASPLSLVAYRVNQDSSQPAYLKLERMGKGLLWNGVANSSNLNNANTLLPIVFLPQTITGMNRPWYAAVNNDNTNKSQDADYEAIGPQVFRFEYYYLLKNGSVTDVPWDTDAGHTSLTGIGLADIEAIAVAIAVIDPASRSLISDSSLFSLASDMADFKTAPGNGNGGAKKIGDMEAQWNTVVQTTAVSGQASDGSPVPPAAAKAIRIYNRYFDLRIL